MQVSISTRHGQLSSDVQERISEKVGKLRRLNDRITSIEATVDLEHSDAPQVELCVAAERTDAFVANCSASNVLAALDGAQHKIEQQLRKHKEKVTGHRSTGLGRLGAPAEIEPESE